MKYKYNDFLNQYNLYISSYNNLINNKLLFDKFFLFFLISICIMLISINNIKFIESIIILTTIIYTWLLTSKQFYLRIKLKMKIIINMENKLLGYKPFSEEIKLLEKIQTYENEININKTENKWNNYKNIIKNFTYYKIFIIKKCIYFYKNFTKKETININSIYSTNNIKLTFLIIILIYSIIKLFH
ncbi:MAG: hypothetical protein HYZ30_00800 [Candidatus Azosocius agrarius]|nr:MAG: hypothetical protein HYZ30_00800 [Gammaproteobacteria bacterium]